MEESIKVNVDPETMDYLQELFYEHLCYKMILEDILLLKRNYEHNEKTYKLFMEDFKKATTELELAKLEIIKTYAGAEYTKSNYFNEFDFNNRELILTKISG